MCDIYAQLTRHTIVIGREYYLNFDLMNRMYLRGEQDGQD